MGTDTCLNSPSADEGWGRHRHHAHAELDFEDGQQLSEGARLVHGVYYLHERRGIR